ncbi:reprolysin-like metallopeptidase [Hyphobacterium sp.]|uniref:Ig-like domain-containing protein n=1 Tax=Hyphobacterium sp. TaxID=2004662 RepID=UPI003BAC225F
MRVVLSLCLLLMPAAAFAQVPAAWELPMIAASEPDGEPTLETVETDAFAARVGISDRLPRLMPGDAVRVPLPDGQTPDGVVTLNRPTASGGRHLQIEFEGGAGRVLIHVGLNATYGRIWDGEREFEIVPAGVRAHVLRTPADLPDLVDDGLLDTTRPPLTEAMAEDEFDSPKAGSDVLDFLYFYDIEMIETHGWGLPDLAATDIGNLTTALVNSGVPLTADLTQLQFMDVERDYASDTLLTDLGGRSGIFTGLQDRIDALQTDVISLNRVYDSDRESFCGLGYVHNPTSSLFGRSHINVCHNGLTLAHETGHNMGLSHGVATECDPGQDNCADSRGVPVDWARGYRIDSATADGGIFTSVMAYGTGRTPQFSDPDVVCPERGSRCGVPIDDPAGNGADATQALATYAVDQPSRGTPNTRLRSAVLPTSRYIATNTAATAFMTVINPGSVDGTNCIIEHHGPYRDSFSYQTTDPATNALTGSADTPVDIAAGAFQTFMISITPSADITETVRFAPYATCDNIPMPLVSPGLNTIDLGADTGGGPDLIALAATINANGIVDIPAGRRGVFSVATLNLGGAGDVTVSATSLDPGLPSTAQVCQTGSGGACLAAPADSLTLTIDGGDTPTFGVFVRSDYVTPFNARQRLQFQMKVDGEVRGSTSVAIRDEGDLAPPSIGDDAQTLRSYETVSGNLATLAAGYYDRFEIVTQPTRGTVTLDGTTGAYSYVAGGSAGDDTFTYRAGNAAGWSAPATAAITVTALPSPVVTAFSLADDTDGEFAIDLDDHADSSIAIDRFVLISPPSGSHEFNELTGVISGTLPGTEGAYGFTFAAENRTGRSAPVSGEFDVAAYDACAPARLTEPRLRRRLEALELVNADPSVDEAVEIATALCMEEYSRSGTTWVYFQNATHGARVVFGPRIGPRRYIVYYRNSGDATWRGNFTICKNLGRLEDC